MSGTCACSVLTREQVNQLVAIGCDDGALERLDCICRAWRIRPVHVARPTLKERADSLHGIARLAGKLERELNELDFESALEIFVASPWGRKRDDGGAESVEVGDSALIERLRYVGAAAKAAADKVDVERSQGRGRGRRLTAGRCYVLVSDLVNVLRATGVTASAAVNSRMLEAVQICFYAAREDASAQEELSFFLGKRKKGGAKVNCG